MFNEDRIPSAHVLETSAKRALAERAAIANDVYAKVLAELAARDPRILCPRGWTPPRLSRYRETRFRLEHRGRPAVGRQLAVMGRHSLPSQGGGYG
jgi:hypothetical protein